MKLMYTQQIQRKMISENRGPKQHTANQPRRPPHTPDNDLRPHTPDIPAECRLGENSLDGDAGIPADAKEDSRWRKEVEEDQAQTGSGETSRGGTLQAGDEAEGRTEETDHE
jgi:hypothetical protein